MTAALEIQKAMYDALRQHNALAALLGGEHIFDDVPAGSHFPYIVFGEVESLDWSTGTEGGEEHFVDVEIWSERDGRKEALEIAAEVRTCLDTLCATLPVAMSNHQLVNLATQSTLSSRRQKNRLFQAIMTVRAVTEPVVG